MCLSTFFLLILHLPCVFSVTCRDVVSSGIAEERITCHEFLQTLGFVDNFFHKTTAISRNCMVLKEISYILQDDMPITCHCPSGYTDIYGNINTGLINNILPGDLSKITCNIECSAVYDGLMRSENEGICECLNFGGCMFSERNINAKIIPNVQNIIRIPDDLKRDISIVPCKQLDCKKAVEIEDVNICLFFNIEFSFCGECPVQCKNKNMDCIVDLSSKQCVEKCIRGFFLSDEKHCVRCTECLVNEYMNTECTLYEDATCATCPLGTHMPFAHTDVSNCMPCPYKSTNQVLGGSCVYCGDTYIVSAAGKCVDCNISDDYILKPHATVCSDIIPVISSHNYSLFCKVGYMWNEMIAACVPCKINTFRNENSITCIECPRNHVTSEVASSDCMSCPETHFRPEREFHCQTCAPGEYLNYISTHDRNCLQCPINTISVSGVSLCENCSSLFYSNPTNTKCVHCEAGKLRINNSISCEYCPVGFYIQDDECQACNFANNIFCGNMFHTVSNCLSIDIEDQPCVCGCKECKWQSYIDNANNIDVELFLIPPCTLSCKPGFRLLYNENTPYCMLDTQYYVNTYSDEYGIYVFSSNNSSDMTLYSCLSYFTLRPSTINTTFGMKQCHSKSLLGKALVETTLSEHIIDGLRSVVDYNCFFCCKPGYVFVNSRLDMKLFKCVPEKTCADDERLISVYE